MFDQYTRNQQRKSMNWPLLVGVIAAIVVGGWLVLQAKERHDIAEMNSLFESMPSSPRREIDQGKPKLQQLPGMSLEVTGELALTGDYDHGDASRGDTWRISWTPNTKLAAPEDVPTQVSYIAERTGTTAGPVRTSTLDQAPAFEVDFTGAASGNLIISTCGDRSIEIFSGDPMATERVKKTFRCTPHAGRLVYRSAAVSPRTGWTQIPDKTTVQLKSRDVEMILAAAGTNTITLKVFDQAFDLDPAIEHHGIYSIRRGKVHRGDESVHPGARVSWPCPALDANGYAYISQVGATGLADGIALAETGRCLAPSEPAPSY